MGPSSRAAGGSPASPAPTRFVQFAARTGDPLARRGFLRHLNAVTRNAQTPAPLSRRLAVAPMMEWTDRHCRYFHRLLTRRALLYTEMISTGAVLHGDRARLLGFDPAEHPLAVQLGGSDPRALAQAARI